MTQEATDNFRACVRCLYFREPATGSGECHRYPPVFAGSDAANERHHWKHPRVTQQNWCGEFKPRPAD